MGHTLVCGDLPEWTKYSSYTADAHDIESRMPTRLHAQVRTHGANLSGSRTLHAARVPGRAQIIQVDLDVNKAAEGLSPPPHRVTEKGH